MGRVCNMHENDTVTKIRKVEVKCDLDFLLMDRVISLAHKHI
jgi:hypothetical protein